VSAIANDDDDLTGAGAGGPQIVDEALADIVLVKK